MWTPICRQFRAQTCQNTPPVIQLPYSWPSKQGHAVSYFDGGNKRQFYILKRRLYYIVKGPYTFREENRHTGNTQRLEQTHGELGYAHHVYNATHSQQQSDIPVIFFRLFLAVL